MRALQLRSADQDGEGGSALENLQAQSVVSRKHLLTEKMSMHLRFGLAKRLCF